MIANPIYPPKYQQEILFVTFSIILSCGIFGYAVNQRIYLPNLNIIYTKYTNKSWANSRKYGQSARKHSKRT